MFKILNFFKNLKVLLAFLSLGSINLLAPIDPAGKTIDAKAGGTHSIENRQKKRVAAQERQREKQERQRKKQERKGTGKTIDAKAGGTRSLVKREESIRNALLLEEQAGRSMLEKMRALKTALREQELRKIAMRDKQATLEQDEISERTSFNQDEDFKRKAIERSKNLAIIAEESKAIVRREKADAAKILEKHRRESEAERIAREAIKTLNTTNNPDPKRVKIQGEQALEFINLNQDFDREILSKEEKTDRSMLEKRRALSLRKTAQRELEQRKMEEEDERVQKETQFYQTNLWLSDKFGKILPQFKGRDKFIKDLQFEWTILEIALVNTYSKPTFTQWLFGTDPRNRSQKQLLFLRTLYNNLYSNLTDPLIKDSIIYKRHGNANVSLLEFAKTIKNPSISSRAFAFLAGLFRWRKVSAPADSQV